MEVQLNNLYVVTNGVVWRLTAIYFLIQIGFYGLNIWLPHVVKTITGGTSWQVGLVTAIPYVVAMAGLWFGRRGTHVATSPAGRTRGQRCSLFTGGHAALPTCSYWILPERRCAPERGHE